MIVLLIVLDPVDASICIQHLTTKSTKCPHCGGVIEHILQKVMPDPDRRAFCSATGYCLLGLTVEQCLLFFYGAGRNGKSTFIDLIVEIVGDYAVSMSIDSFAGDSQRGQSNRNVDITRSVTYCSPKPQNPYYRS